ncbi:uncharacterized protein PG998_006999 [Apiospora kogelbergensis]|uniref:uncharacterized protein n=1 Tax=Apiospora kogelbergensis TaxID=1337665 RepID=UPI003132805D
MPSDDYSSFGGGGALKLKGGKVTKHKKKKKDRGTGSDLEKSLSTGQNDNTALEEKKKKKKKSKESGSDNDDEKKRRDAEDDARPVEYKTEAERRHEEFQRKKLLKLSESSSSRPELLKTHKERVEELNTYLSKLSEHHDMPKIGPG